MELTEIAMNCRGCGSPLNGDGIEGFCQRCLAGAAFGAAEESSGAIDQATGTGHRLADYELLAEIGRGGMGVVWRARQTTLNRLVALKVLRHGPFTGASEVLRFQREAQAAASLSHPNVVAIHEIGAAGGHHFLSMDLVDGPTLADLTRDGPLAPERGARYAKGIAEAVAAAHAQGILHRDLKPSNVLIDATDQVRVTDFGLAKRLDARSDLTTTQQVVGSPVYMAPEQVDPNRGALTYASDIYSIGALLYQLLTGHPPFIASTMAATFTRVLNDQPDSVRRLNPAVPLDLDTICLKCLRKEPARRYPSAAALAEDLTAFLDKRPISARPISVSERVVLWRRRYPALAASVVLIGLLLLTISVVSITAALRVQRARDGEAAQRRMAEGANSNLTTTVRQLELANQQLAQTVTTLEMRQAEAYAAAGNSDLALAAWSGILRQDPSNAVVAERLLGSLIRGDLAFLVAPPARYPPSAPGPAPRVRAARFSPDGHHLLTVADNGEAKLWDAKSLAPVAGFHEPSPLLDAAFSPDGLFMATATEDGTIGLADRLGTRLQRLQLDGGAFSVSFLKGDEGLEVLAVGKSRANIWKMSFGRAGAEPVSITGDWRAVSVGPDWRRLALAGGTRLELHTASGETTGVVTNFSAPITAVAFGQVAEGLRVAAQDENGVVYLCDGITGARVCELGAAGHLTPVGVVAFDPTGRWLASGTGDDTARFWDLRWSTPVVSATLRHEAEVWRIAFSPDGKRVLTGSADNTARVWSSETGAPLSQPLRHRERIGAVAFSPDGSQVVTASFDGSVNLWRFPLRPWPPVELVHAEVWNVQFSPDGRWIATLSYDQRTTRIWRAADGQPSSPLLQHAGKIQQVVFMPDSRSLISGSSDGAIRFWAVPEGHLARPVIELGAAVTRVAVSRNGRTLEAGCGDGTVAAWELPGGKPRFVWRAHAREVTALAFSADDRWLVSGSQDGSARICDAGTGEPVGPAVQHEDAITDVAFSPDSQWIVTASNDNTARVVNWRTGELRWPPLHQERSVTSAGFSPDGTTLFTTSLDHTASLWNAATGRRRGEVLRHDERVAYGHFSPDGQRFLTGTYNKGTVRLWDARTGFPLSEPLPGGSVAQRVAFAPDGRHLAVAHSGGPANVWTLVTPPVPAPEWLPQLAEAIARRRVAPGSGWMPVDDTEFFSVRQRILASPDHDPATEAIRRMLTAGAPEPNAAPAR